MWKEISLAEQCAIYARAIMERDLEIKRLRYALRIIAGKEQPIDNLMSNQDIALSALGETDDGN